MPGFASQDLYYVLRNQLSSGQFVPTELSGYPFRNWLPRGAILFAPKDTPLMEYGEPEPTPQPTLFYTGLGWQSLGKWQLTTPLDDGEKEVSIADIAWGPFHLPTLKEGLFLPDGKMESGQKKSLSLFDVTLGAIIDPLSDDDDLQENVLRNQGLMAQICSEYPPLLTLSDLQFIPALALTPTQFGWIDRNDR